MLRNLLCFQKFLCSFVLCLMLSCFYVSVSLGIQVKFDVNYREAATIFDIMDNVALWSTDGWCDPEFRCYWDKIFPSLPLDHVLFKKYADLRKKYFRKSESTDGLFVSFKTLKEDPVASVFYSSSTLEEAFTKLKMMKPSEVNFLRAFYKHFSKRYLALIRGCSDFSSAIQSERQKLMDPQILDYLGLVAEFYQVNTPFSFHVVHTWFPPVNQTTAKLSGEYLILRSNAEYHGDDDQSDIVFHEVIHAISRHQSQSQKQALTKAFLQEAHTTLPDNELYVIEEPFAVVLGQMLYCDLFDPQKFKECKTKDNWYMDQGVNTYAKAIYPLIKKAVLNHKTLDTDFIRKLATLAPPR